MLAKTENPGQNGKLIYMDANSTTPVLPSILDIAATTMQGGFGNPSSNHAMGYLAKKQLDFARKMASQAIGANSEEITFMSGATEAIQTAIISALLDYKTKENNGGRRKVLLYGSTEHKAVPNTLKYWRDNLDINADVLAIPADRRGLLDLSFIRKHIHDAIIVCTMYVNNETGVIQDIESIQQCFTDFHSDALWLVDCVQALGKCDIDLSKSRIDYAPFSGHKLYSPKGVGMLYVRDGAPFKPLVAGGGQEAGLRSGTENTIGISAFGSVLSILNQRNADVFHSNDTLETYRNMLLGALDQAFKGIVYNTPLDISVPTTINFSVPDIPSPQLINMFNAVGILVSAGSACNSSERNSFVLDAMGLDKWRSENAIRLSFGPATSHEEIEEACRRIREIGELARSNNLFVTSVQTTEIVSHQIQWQGKLPAPQTWESLFKQKKKNTVLVDVRSTIEWHLCKRPSIYKLPYPIKSIPIESLLESLNIEADKDQHYIFVCHTGARSIDAARIANEYGFSATYVEDGWQHLDTRF